MSKPDIDEKLILTRENLRQFEPISNLSDERLDELVSLSYIEIVNIGTKLFQEGDTDNQTLYLLKGDVQLNSTSNNSEIIIKSHSDEGKYPLDDSQPRQCMALAMSYVEIIRIDNSVLDYMMMWDQLAVAEVSNSQSQVSSPEMEHLEPNTESIVKNSNSDSVQVDPQEKKLQETINLVTSVIDEQIQKSVNESKVVYTKENLQSTISTDKSMINNSITIQGEPAIADDAIKKATKKTTSKRKTASKKKSAITKQAKPIKSISNEILDQKPNTTLTEKISDNDEQSTNNNSIVHESRDWIRKIRQIMAFKNMPAANIKNLLEKMETISVKEGQQIIEQGSNGDYYYVLTDGSAIVTRTIELAKIGPGNSFGEEALVAKSPRNASVKMTSDGVLMRLAKKDFDELLIEPLMDRVSPEQARLKILQGAKWLDVRHAKEFHRSRLPGAINIPLHELRIRIEELDKDTEYICCCRTGARSSSGSFLLAQNGFKVSLLTGGIQAMSQDLRR